MNKESLLKSLAEHGYNIQFGARKNYATYDIVEKVPSGLSYAILFIGVIQLAYPNFPYNQMVSLLLILMSLAALIISTYNSEKEKYCTVADQLILLHNRLRDLYYKVKSSDKDDFSEEYEEMKKVEKEYYDLNKHKQIMFSDWYAHYKFFYQVQHEWIDEQKHFTWKDKVPAALRLARIPLGLLLLGVFMIIVVTIANLITKKYF